MRELARFVPAARKLDPKVTWLADCLSPDKFDIAVKAVKELWWRGGGLSCVCAFNAGMLSGARDVGLNAVYRREGLRDATACRRAQYRL